jgi:uncharacterized membrane protein
VTSAVNASQAHTAAVSQRLVPVAASAHRASQKASDDRTVGERVADETASFGGSWPLIVIFLGLIPGHVLHSKAFDPIRTSR